MIKYTQGDEYLLNGVPYIGAYTIVNDDTDYAYSGKTYIFGISKKLIPIEQDEDKTDIGIYSRLNTFYYNMPIWNPVYKYPIVTESDIDNGYIFRYFAQKSNNLDNPIIEISKDDYNGSDLYTFIKIKWYIVGTKMMVLALNYQSIEEGSKTINNLRYVLTNMLELKNK